MAINTNNSVNIQPIQQNQLNNQTNSTPKSDKGSLAGLNIQQAKPISDSPSLSGNQSVNNANRSSLSIRPVNSTTESPLAKSSKSSDFGNILKNLSSFLQPSAKSSKSLLDKVKSAADPDDSGIKDAASGTSSKANGGPQLINNGGKVLDKPAIDNIYLGSYYNTTQGKSDVAHQDAASKAWVTSGNEALLKQYGVGQGSFAGSHVVSGNAPRTFTASQVESLVKQQLASGKSPAGDQTIHTVYLPPGTVLKDGDATSQNGLGGFHGSYQDPATGKNVYYAVIAYSKGSNGIDFTGNPQDNNSITASHEWSEAATDPNVADVNRGAPSQGTLGWYDNRLGEIGDIPINISKDPSLSDVWGKVGGFAFQKEWSNKDNKSMLTI